LKFQHSWSVSVVRTGNITLPDEGTSFLRAPVESV